MSLPDLSLLRKHYEIQQTALNEIAELIALRDARPYSALAAEELLSKIDDIAAFARQTDLFNPHNRPGDADFIRKYDPNRDIASQVSE